MCMLMQRARLLSTGDYYFTRYGRSGAASPFLLYLLCSSTAVVAAGDIFHRAVYASVCMCVCTCAPSTVISTKIRQRLAIVRVSVPASAYCATIFFLPDTHQRTYVTIFMPRAPAWIRYTATVDLRSMNDDCNKMQSPARPKDHRAARFRRATELHRRSEFLFPLLFLAIMPSGVERSGTLHTGMQLLAKIRFIGSRWRSLLARASYSREARVAQNGK